MFTVIPLVNVSNVRFHLQVCVVLIRRDSVWGPSDKRSHTILALLLIVAICVGLVGCFFIVLLTKRVSNEMRLRAALIQQLEATKQAENKSSHKSIVFASMSHDLRTPLAAILGLIDLCLCDAVESSELESNLSQMKSCATNLLGEFVISSCIQVDIYESLIKLSLLVLIARSLWYYKTTRIRSHLYYSCSS